MIRVSLAVVEIVILSALVFATRCANYQDVFVAGNVYFVDADCYARMTRVRMCATRPGLILRHHDFENFPQGTTPHTTAPLDYLILALALLFKPFTTQPLEVAGAFVSPLLALAAAWFLWWWSRQMKFRYGWVMLILFAISPILVHGTALGRPDHQSLLILLVTIAICAEWTLQNLQVTGWLTSSKADGGLETAAPCSQDDAIRESRIACRRSIVLGCVPAATAARLPYHVESGMQAWSLTSAVAWALAIWVSLYEPLILFVMMIATTFLVNRPALFESDGPAAVDRIAQQVEHAAQRSLADGDRNGRAGVGHVHAADHAVGRAERDAAHAAAPQMLLHLAGEPELHAFDGRVDRYGIVDFGKPVFGKLDVKRRADDLRDLADRRGLHTTGNSFRGSFNSCHGTLS